METERNQRNRLLTARMAWRAIISLVAVLFLAGCGRDSAPSADQTAAQPTAAAIAEQQKDVGTVLRAVPNPVPAGNAPAKTTIIWQTGSDSEADIFYFD